MPRKTAGPPLDGASRAASPAAGDKSGGGGVSSRRDDSYGDLKAPPGTAPLSESRRHPRSLHGDGHTPASGRRSARVRTSSAAASRREQPASARSHARSPSPHGSPLPTRWSPERSDHATPRAEVVRQQSWGSTVHTAVATNAARRKLGDSAGVGVPKEAFLRVNIMDVVDYQQRDKLVTLKLYIDVTWRQRGVAELLGKIPAEKREDYKWSNSDATTDNNLPEKTWKQAPLGFQAKHNVSDFIDNIKPGNEQWNDWYEVDKSSEQRFETMGEVLDPNDVGPDAGIRWLSYRGVGTITLKQPTNLRAYPFDTQTIQVTVWHKDDWRLQPNRCKNENLSSYASTFDRAKMHDNLEWGECW